MRLRGGMPGATPGDQLCHAGNPCAKAQTDAQRKLYEQMAEAFDYSPRPASKNNEIARVAR
jgi:curved DNA-binding protein